MKKRLFVGLIIALMTIGFTGCSGIDGKVVTTTAVSTGIGSDGRVITETRITEETITEGVLTETILYEDVTKSW